MIKWTVLMQYKLNSEFEDLKDFLLNVQDHFNENNILIHDARNKLKVIPYKNYSIVVKSFKVPNPINQIVYRYLRDSKAKKSYNNAITLEELDITNPTPIGYIEFHSTTGILLKESYFLSLESKYDFTIREPLLDKNWPDHDQIFREFGAFTYNLHQKNVFHKDYSPGNILIIKKQKQDTISFRFDLVDINRMSFTPLSFEDKMRNFSKLWADAEDLQLIAEGYKDANPSMMIKYDLDNKKTKIFKRELKAKLFKKGNKLS